MILTGRLLVGLIFFFGPSAAAELPTTKNSCPTAPNAHKTPLFSGLLAVSKIQRERTGPQWRCQYRISSLGAYMAGMPLFTHAGREKLTPPPLSAPLKPERKCPALLGSARKIIRAIPQKKIVLTRQQTKNTPKKHKNTPQKAQKHKKDGKNTQKKFRACARN